MRRRIVYILAIVLAASACGWGAGSSPTATLEAFNQAMRKKDSAAIKKTLSKRSLEIIGLEAKLAEQSLDEAIQEGLAKVPPDFKTPEMRNEKIKGNTATVEVKDEEKHLWFPVSFVKEDEQWKIAYDKAMRDPSHKMHGKPFVDAIPDK